MQKKQKVYGNIAKIYQFEMLMMVNLLLLTQTILLIHLNLKQKSQAKLEMMEQKMLKYLSNFWRTLEMPLINCEVNLILTWSSTCVIVSTGNANQAVKFAITDTKLYVLY